MFFINVFFIVINTNRLLYIFCCAVSPSSKELNSFLFPEWELVTEPEELLPPKDEEAHESQNLDQEHTALYNGMHLETIVRKINIWRIWSLSVYLPSQIWKIVS